MVKNEGIVLFSGGLDSTTLLYKTYLMHDRKILAISFDYGQRHKKELSFAQYHIKHLNISQIIIPLKFHYKNNTLLSKNALIPHEHYTHKNQKLTVVPCRNMIMLSLAIGIAEDKNIPFVYYAAHRNDSTTYPDCRPDFVKAINKTAMAGTYNHIEVRAPFVHIYKSDIVKIGIEIGVDYYKTWSCYEGGKHHCGKCGTCQERIEAFAKNGLTPVMP